jgi:hypothetical protein
MGIVSAHAAAAARESVVRGRKTDLLKVRGQGRTTSPAPTRRSAAP